MCIGLFQVTNFFHHLFSSFYSIQVFVHWLTRVLEWYATNS